MSAKQIFRRGAAALLGAVLILAMIPQTVLAKPSWPSCPVIASESGIVIDEDSGAMLYGQNVHQQQAPASITKLLTALIVLENCSLDEKVTYSHEAMTRLEPGCGNKYNMAEGDELTVEDALYLLLLASSNQTANALAEHTAGSIDQFVDLMNRKCDELGCQESHFANPSGLNDSTQLTSAWDMALIARAAMDDAELLKIDSTTSHDIPATKNNPNGATVTMEHKLLVTANPSDPNYYPYAVAGKTGYTSIAGQTLVTYAAKDGRREIAVTLKSTQRTHYADTVTMLDFGFNNFKNINISENASLPDGDPVKLGKKKYARSDLTLDQDAAVTLPNDAKFSDADEKLVTKDFPADAPAGTVAMLVYTYDDREVGSAAIVSAEAAEKAKNTVVRIRGKKDGETATGSQVSGSSGIFSGLWSRLGEAFGAAYGAVTDAASAAGAWYRSLNLSRAQLAGILGAAAAILAAVIFAILRARRKNAEQRYLTASKERRKQRLKESGVSEEEFARMVNRVRNRGSLETPAEKATEPEAQEAPAEKAAEPEAQEAPAEKAAEPEAQEAPAEKAAGPEAPEKPAEKD
jgi:D-alanyl-D-alanine carboxypeptidase (penicillin-binding protein 5/6)